MAITERFVSTSAAPLVGARVEPVSNAGRSPSIVTTAVPRGPRGLWAALCDNGIEVELPEVELVDLRGTGAHLDYLASIQP